MLDNELLKHERFILEDIKTDVLIEYSIAKEKGKIIRIAKECIIKTEKRSLSIDAGLKMTEIVNV